MNDSLCHVHARGDEPDAEHSDRHGDDRRHEHAGNAVGNALDRGLAARGVIHQFDDMGERRVVTHARGTHAHVPGNSHRAC